MFTIYALVDPRDQATRYVGMTEDIYSRLQQHIRGEASRHAKNAWIQELRAANLMVTMLNLEQVADLEYAREREVYWIFHFLGLNAPLLNQQMPLLDQHKAVVQKVVQVSSPRSRKHVTSRARKKHVHPTAVIRPKLASKEMKARAFAFIAQHRLDHQREPTVEQIGAFVPCAQGTASQYRSAYRREVLQTV